MKNKIPEFLQKKLDMAGNARASKFPQEIKNFMTDYSAFYEWQLSDNYQIIYKLMKRNITVLPVCGYNGCKNKIGVNYKEG